MKVINHFIPTGILFLATIALGYWVSRKGRPYHNLLFNIHKLLALAGVVLTGIRFFQLDPLVIFPRGILFLAALGSVFVLGLFATGAILSIREEESGLLINIHRVSMASITVVSVAASLLYLI